LNATVTGDTGQLRLLRRDGIPEEVSDTAGHDLQTRLRGFHGGGPDLIPGADAKNENANRQNTANGKRKALPQ
jgi:hypothetical protein